MRTGLAVALLAVAVAGSPALLAVLPDDGPAPPTPDAWLGLFLEDEPDGGARIVGVVPGGPAGLAGLEEGDLLLSVNGKPVTDRLAVRKVVGRLRVGERLAVEVLRDGDVERREIVAAPPAIRVPARGTPRAAPPRDPLAAAVGLRVVSIPEELRRFYGAPADAGFLVVAVEPGSPAETGGVRVGDVVLRAGGRILRSRADLEEAFLGWPEAGRVGLRLVRSRARIDVAVDPPEGAEEARAKEDRVRALEDEVAAAERRLEDLRRELRSLREER